MLAAPYLRRDSVDLGLTLKSVSTAVHRSSGWSVRKCDHGLSSPSRRSRLYETYEMLMQIWEFISHVIDVDFYTLSAPSYLAIYEEKKLTCAGRRVTAKCCQIQMLSSSILRASTSSRALPSYFSLAVLLYIHGLRPLRMSLTYVSLEPRLRFIGRLSPCLTVITRDKNTTDNMSIKQIHSRI